MLTDTHTHLDDIQFKGEVDAVIQRALDAGMGFILNPGVDEATSAQAVAFSEAYDVMYAGVGFYPDNAAEFDEAKHLPMMRDWCALKKTLAIGEIGLDYHYDDGAPRDLQKKVFETQVAFAGSVNLPIVIHDRDAHGDTMAIVKSTMNRESGGEFHCYSGSVEMAREILDLGMYLGFGGALTFKNARKAPEVVAYAPLDRLLLETDAPYMAPVPLRGTRNEPRNTQLVAEKIAEIKKIDVEDVIEATWQNAKRLFRF